MYTKNPATNRANADPDLPAPAANAPNSSESPGLDDRRLRNALDNLLRHARADGSSAAPPEFTDSENAFIFRTNVAAGSSADAFDLHPASAPSASQPPTIDGYEIIEPIRTGGQGVVFKALQKSTQRTVAIKLTRLAGWRADGQRQRFEREVLLTSRLNHPHIVTIFDSGAADGRLYFVMEYVDGATVDEFALLKKLPIRDCVRLVVAICRAVQYAHRNGIIHRDLKPSNILVDKDGNPHILDFGLAKDLITPAPVNPADAPSVSGQVVGTLPYLSPEQAEGRSRDADIRADVYTLGVILFQLLSRQFPYSVVGHPDEVRANIISRPPLPLRRALSSMSIAAPRGDATLLAELEAVLLRTLEKNPDRRYQSVGELADDLERCLAGEPVQARQHDRWFLLRRTIRAYRTHVIVAAAFALVLLVAAAGVIVAWRRSNAAWLRSEQVAQTASDGLTMGSFNRLGSVARNEGQYDDAIVLYEKAIEIGGSAVADNPVLCRMAIQAYSGAALASKSRGDLGDFSARVKRAVALSDRLLQIDPDSELSRQTRARVLHLQGIHSIARESWTTGIPLLVEATHIFSDLQTLDPENDRLVYERAVSESNLGTCYRRLARMPEAHEAYAAALAHFEDAYRRNPKNFDAAIEACVARDKLAAWHIDQKTVADYFKAIEYENVADQSLDKLGRGGFLRSRAPDAVDLSNSISHNRALAKAKLRKLGIDPASTEAPDHRPR